MPAIGAGTTETVLRFGKSSAFAEARVSFASSGELVAHATLEFAF